jgi:beta-galactosidase
VTASVVDEKGVACPRADNKITFSVSGSGKLRAVDNGDPTSLESFVDPVRSAFNGRCVAIIQSTSATGEMKLVAQSPGLGKTEISIRISK